MRVTLLLAISLTVLAGVPAPSSAQESGSKAQTSPAKPKKGPQGQPDEGTIANNVYSENFFLLRYTIPQGWVVKTLEMRQGLPGQQSAVLLLSAFEKAEPSAGEVNSSINISAESTAASQAIKTPEDYLGLIADFASSKGFTVLNAPGEITLGGVNFLREDFLKEEGDVGTYQATMVTMRRGYLLQITVITGNVEELTPLLNRLQITAPPTLKKP